MKKTYIIFLLSIISMFSAKAQEPFWQKLQTVGDYINTVNEDSKGVLFAALSNYNIPQLCGLYSSTDHGATWSYRGLMGNDGIKSICFDSNDNIFLAADITYPEKISGLFRTTDGGADWDTLNKSLERELMEPSPKLNTMAIDSKGTIFINNLTFGTLRTHDQGNSWFRMGNTSLHSKWIYADRFDSVYFYIGAKLYRTSGNYENTIAIKLSGIDPLLITSMVTDSKGNIYIGGNTLVRSTDKGKTWTLPTEPTGQKLRNIRALAADSSDVIYVSLWDGIYRYYPDLDSLENVSSITTTSGPANLTATGFMVARDGYVYAVNNEGLYRSVNPIVSVEENIDSQDKNEINILQENGRTTLYYKSTTDTELTFSIYDYTGNQIINKKLYSGNPGSNVEIGLDNLFPGVYMYRISFSNEVRTGKLLVR